MSFTTDFLEKAISCVEGSKMKAWEARKLGEVAIFINGRAYKATEFKETGTPIVRIQNLTGVGNTVYSDIELPEDKYINYGDLIYAWSATFGPYIWKGPKSIFHYHIWKIHCTDVDKEFLYYHLKRASDDMKDSGNGTLFIHITKELMESFPILLPPLPEQRAIASVLSSLDDKIDLLHRQNKTLEAMAETLFRQWFVEEADEGWEEGKVLDYCTHHKVGVKPQDFPTKSYSHYSIPAFDNNMNPIIENGSEIQSNKYTVIPNCLLFSKLNPNKDKRIWLILNQLNESSVCSTEFQVVLPNSRKYLFFLYAWLSIPRNYNEIASGVGGTSGSHQRIDPADIFNFPCPHIDDSYIETFNVAAEPIFMKMSNNRIQIRTLEKLRDTLLPKLMSGEVRVDYKKEAAGEY